MRAKRTKFGLLIALIYLLGLEGYTLVNKEPNDTISEVFQEWGYEYPVLIVGAWFILAGHWWWRIGGPKKYREPTTLIDKSIAATICRDCGHSLEDNNHGFDQNDGYLDENDRFIHKGKCTYCKECNPRLGKAINARE